MHIIQRLASANAKQASIEEPALYAHSTPARSTGFEHGPAKLHRNCKGLTSREYGIARDMTYLAPGRSTNVRGEMTPTGQTASSTIKAEDMAMAVSPAVHPRPKATAALKTLVGSTEGQSQRQPLSMPSTRSKSRSQLWRKEHEHATRPDGSPLMSRTLESSHVPALRRSYRLASRHGLWKPFCADSVERSLLCFLVLRHCRRPAAILAPRVLSLQPPQ